MARVAAIVTDLMLSSRVQEGLRAAGHEVVTAASVSAAAEAGADAVVCDLDVVDPDELARLGVPAMGFYSHVDVEARRRAEAAGVDLVVPRSRMSRELGQLVANLLSD